MCNDPDYPDYTCVTDGGGPAPDDDGDGVPNELPEGLYLTYSNIDDLKEPWIRGDPEIEVHVWGPPTSYGPQEYAAISCASESSPGYRRFNQNTHVFSGPVLLMTKDEIEQNHYSDTATYNGGRRKFRVALYEDDTTRCQIHGDWLRYAAIYGYLGSVGAWGVDMAIEKCPTYFPQSQTACLQKYLTFYALLALPAVYQAIQTNDDFIGFAIASGSGGLFASSSDYHVLTDGDNSMHSNGEVKLVYHVYGQ